MYENVQVNEFVSHWCVAQRFGLLGNVSVFVIVILVKEPLSVLNYFLISPGNNKKLCVNIICDIILISCTKGSFIALKEIKLLQNCTNLML